SWTRHKQFERFLKACVVHQMRHAHLLLDVVFVQPARSIGDHFLFRLGDWAGLIRKASNRGIVTVFRRKSVESLDQVPRRTVEPCFVARVNVFSWATPPFFTGRNEFNLDHPFSAERDGDLSIEALTG